MATIIESVDVKVPVRTAYNQWTQFEEFPQFMDGIEQVEQKDDERLHWRASFGGKTHEWDARITEQVPDERVAWRDEGGKENAGVVTFHKLDEGLTRVTVQMDWEPEGIAETIGAALAMDDAKLKGDLERFRDFIEDRGEETGAWRGEVEQSKT